MEPIKIKNKRTSIIEFKESNCEIYKLLCARLDLNDAWRTLFQSIYVKTTTAELEDIARQSVVLSMRPSDIVLTKLSHKMHSIEEVFLHLYKNDQLVICSLIKPYVSEGHQKIFEGGQSNIERERMAQAKYAEYNGHQEGQYYSESKVNPKIQCGYDSGNLRMIIKPAGLVKSGPSKHLRGYEYSLSTRKYDDDPQSLTAMFNNQILEVKYDDLMKATNNWSKNNKIGSGGFGEVYKGELNFTTVAVKRLKDKRTNVRYKELIAEMFTNQYRHEDILPLYRYSVNGPVACLVFQYIKGGSLDQRLRLETQHPPLSWSQRLGIARGVARGLAFLHTHESRLIHGDIKPHNILLNELCDPKIGDFGFATLVDENTPVAKVSQIRGTQPYMPMESEMSTAFDVYSFGVVLFEIATGLKSYDISYPDKLLTAHMHQLSKLENYDFAQLEDNNMENKNPEFCRNFINYGLNCTDHKENRPTMEQLFYNITDIVKEHHPELLN